jgi:hypothetical protein
MSQRGIRKMIVAALALALVASAAAFGEVTLTLEFTDLGPHVGQALSLRVIDVSSLVEVARVTVPAVPSATFQMDVSPFTEGHTYQVDYFLDQNGNGAFDAPPVDAAWRFFISSIQGPGVVGVVHDTAFTNIDWPPLIDGAIASGEYRHTMTDPTTGISVFWQNDAAILYVGLVSPGTGWVGIGFDPDVRMQGADILIAAVVAGALVIQDQFGVAQTFHSSDAQQNIIQAAGTESNGSTFIEFARPLSSGDSVDKALTPGQAVTIILAVQQSDDSFTARHTARMTSTITLDGGT